MFRQARERAGLSLEELAESVGATLRTLELWETAAAPSPRASLLVGAVYLINLRLARLGREQIEIDDVWDQAA